MNRYYTRQSWPSTVAKDLMHLWGWCMV